MLALWIIIGLIVLIAAVLLVPLRIFLRYDEDFHSRFKYGPIPLSDSKSPPNDPTAEPTADAKPKKDASAAKLLDFLGLTEISSIANVKSSVKKVGIAGTLQAIFSSVKKLCGRIFRLVRKGRFKKFRLTILVGDEDGGEAAFQYGQICAVAFPLSAYLKNIMRFSEQQVDIRCDYDLTENVVQFEGQLNYLPWHILCFLGGLTVNYIKNSLKKEKSQ